MKRFKAGALALVVLSLFAAAWFVPFTAIAEKGYEYFSGTDPDMPGFLADHVDQIGKEEYMRLRSEHTAMLRGMATGDVAENIKLRSESVYKMDKQEGARKLLPSSPRLDAMLAAWMSIGPAPIPNGQVQSGLQLPVSGRTTAIAVHPTNPNIVYIGTAQGGLYRTLDGGATWTPLLDNALSLAVGSVVISPSQPDTIYVGTGECQFSADSFFGQGVYRIDNASTATPILSAALGTAQFAGRGIGQIIVDPTNPATIFVASTSGVGGIGGTAAAVLPPRGIYRSTDATSANPTFTQIGVLPAPNNNFSVRDIAIDPSNANIMIADLVVGNGGLYRTTNALAATPTWTQVSVFTGTNTSNLTAEFAAIHPAADANATFYAAAGKNATNTATGSILKSTDGGATFTQINAVTFCNPQCFYNIAIDVDPTNANNVYVGGTGANTFIRSTNGGTNFAASQANLHTDTHAIAVAPSLPTTIYFASDGGIYKSIDSGTNWTSLNNTTLLATQFTGLAVHATDPNYTLGGTQDNGTELQTTAPGNWIRADFGDGGYAVIDQADTTTTLVDLYHTYFNASNLTGYAYNPSTATATEGNWQFRGCSTGGVAANGISCTGTILFYAPLEQGPGSPNNSIYYGADRLYRSTDTGLTNATVSQTFTAPISAIGIAPQDDNVRIIGQSTGGIFGTQAAGATTLTDLDASNAVPNFFIARSVIDPNNVNTAYVTLSYFGGNNVYKTTNLNAAAPTWTAAVGSGANTLPQVPVNGFVVDPLNSNYLYAGTDIGVYNSTDGGATWMPFGTGLPRVPVFDMLIVPNGRMLRIATHGKGMYQMPILLSPTAATVTVSGRATTTTGRSISGTIVSMTDSQGIVRRATTSTMGFYRFVEVNAGETYVFTAKNKRYQFTQPTQVFNVDSDISNINFTGAPTGESGR